MLYARALYILSCITKGQRGMNKILETAPKEANAGNIRVRHFGNKFLNSVEVSAQEPVYLLLQMPLRRSTREFQFINTSNPDERMIERKPHSLQFKKAKILTFTYNLE